MQAQNIITIQDDTGQVVEIPKQPARIVSVVPSQTELLFEILPPERIKGITWFCVHPADKVKNAVKVGGTKKLKIDRIRALEPDLIIANKEENEKDQILRLAKDYPVYVTHVHNFPSALKMIRDIGHITGSPSKAQTIATSIDKGFKKLKPGRSRGSVLYLIWRKPWMTAGGDTFIHSMLSMSGFDNVTGHLNRYPEVDREAIRKLNPDHVFLSSEPYPFTEKHIDEFREILPKANIRLVDGEMFSWYGSRLLKAVKYLEEF